MSGGISAAAIVQAGMTAAVTALASSVFGPDQKGPNLTAPPKPPTPTATAAPSEIARRGSEGSGLAAPSTLLTGAAGVGAGNIGKNTLLGG
jgi:hypothetical protein